MAAPQFIYHIAILADWENQSNEKEYSIESLNEDGFIHCSKYEQLNATLKRFFEDRKDIVVLKIDTKLLNIPLIYEAADDGSGFFPHAFGPIQKNAIIEVITFPFDFN
jgi:uncharacterized protein (DUF952 family)